MGGEKPITDFRKFRNLETVVCLLNRNGNHAMHGRREQRPVCGGAELRNRGGRSFVASLLESLRNARPRYPFNLGKAAVKEP